MRVAADADERALIWKGRKAAFAAVGRISPDYLVQDGVVPRTRLAEALTRIAGLADAAGLRVATVGADDRVVMKPVTIARDYGKTIQIGSGLDPNDRVIQNPPDGVAAGSEVRIAGATPAKS